MRTCEDCGGRGEINYFCVLRDDGSGGPDTLRCYRCGGTGKDSHPLEWRKAGQMMRASRIARGLSLREEAKRLGVSVVELSEMERGLRKPLSGLSGPPPCGHPTCRQNWTDTGEVWCVEGVEGR